MFRQFYVGLSKDRAWALLTLEFKLFATRHPEAKDRFRRIENEQAQRAGIATTALLGSGSRPSAAALGGLLSALILEGDLDPTMLTEARIRSLLGEVFDLLFPVRQTSSKVG